jgi:C4-dicarboxylate-specific signal transduction histidine kinase
LQPSPPFELALPLISRGACIGAILMRGNGPSSFDREDISVIQTLADHVAVTIQNASLHASEKGRSLELEQAYQILKENQTRLLIAEKMASLGRLTAGIAHEMSTPLASVRSALSELNALTQEYKLSISDLEVAPEDHHAIVQEMQQSIQSAVTSAERAASFVRGIKLQTRDIAREREQFNAVPVVHETLQLLNHALRQAKCNLVFEPGNSESILVGSPGRLAQVVTNLVTNAIDASATQGGGTITVGLNSSDGGLELRVVDLGCGIPPENLTKIFDPMFTTKPFGQGTGLGMTIVHDIVTSDFGGSIAVSSEVGQGTTFTIRFPKNAPN